jgi:hypothetical protein
MRVRLTAITRYHPVGSDRRAVSASGESLRVSSGHSTLRFRDFLRSEVALHRLCFGRVLRPHSTTPCSVENLSPEVLGSRAHSPHN